MAVSSNGEISFHATGSFDGGSFDGGGLLFAVTAARLGADDLHCKIACGAMQPRALD